MTESIQLDLSGIDTLVDVFTTDSGINYDGVDVDQFVAKRTAAETFVSKILSKYGLDINQNILTALKPHKLGDQTFDNKISRDRFDLAISRLLPLNGTVSNLLARVIYFKNENFYSYLDLNYSANGTKIVNNSYPIKKVATKVNWNDDFYDEETIKGAELLDKDEKDKLAEKIEGFSLLDSFTTGYVDNIQESSKRVVALLPLCGKFDGQDLFKINDISIDLDKEDPNLSKTLESIYLNVVMTSSNGAFPAFEYMLNDNREIVPYNIKQNLEQIADIIINNLDRRPFVLKRFNEKNSSYNTLIGTFLYRYLTRILKVKIRQLDPNSPYLELINVKPRKNKLDIDNSSSTVGTIEKVIERVNEQGQARRFALINVNNYSIFMSFDQEHPVYEGIDVGNSIIFRSRSQNYSAHKKIDYGFIIRKENSEYVEVFENSIEELIRIHSRNMEDTQFADYRPLYLIASNRTKEYYSPVSNKTKKIRVSKVISYLLNNMNRSDGYSSRESFWVDFGPDFKLVNQDLELYNQTYRDLITANKISNTIAIHDPNVDLQLNIENEAKQKLIIFQKGLARLSSEGKSFSISMNDSQAIEFGERQIKFGNQILKCTSMATVFSDANDKLVQKIRTIPDLTESRYGYSYLGYYQKLKDRLFKTLISIDDIDMKDFENYTCDYDHATGAWNTNKIKTQDFVTKIKADIDRHNKAVKPYLAILVDKESKYFKRKIDPYVDHEITIPVFSLFSNIDKGARTLDLQFMCKELGYNTHYYNNFKLANSNANLDSRSNQFLMESLLTTDDIDFNVLVNKMIHKLDFLFLNQRYGYFDTYIRPNMPVSTKVKLFEATIGSVNATLTVSKSNADVITWYLNGKRLRRDEVSAVLGRALCFNTQEDYNSFVEDISSMSLRARNLVAKGLDITIQNDSGKTATVLLEFERINKVWYLIIRDTNQKKVKQLEIEGGVVKFANSLIKKEQNNNRYAKKRYFSSAGFMTLMRGVKDFTVKDAQNLIATGLRTINEAIARSRKLLEDTVKMVKAQYITHTYGTKTIKGYLVTGISGAKYLVACNKETFEKSYNGTDKFAGVYSMPTLTKICIVDKSIDQNGFDIIVNRILALKNDAYIAENVHTLKPYLGQA